MLRVAATVIDASLHSLQMDYAAFYTAGEAANAGLLSVPQSLGSNPPIWDGVDVITHSRFLYPQLFAALMRPLALLPYSVSKSVGTALTLDCIVLATWLNAPYLRLSRWQMALVRPTTRSFPNWMPLVSRLLAVNYLVAELMQFGGLLGYLRSECYTGVQRERNRATAGQSVARSQLGA